MDSRRYGNPVFFRRDGKSARILTRLNFTDHSIQEGWLQEALRVNPELLPIGEIEPAFGPAISIGREVALSSGSIDNLFISPNGYLTIVETKLWRNPEARREVVGQILDYAKDFSRWTYNDLEASTRQYTQKCCGTSQKLFDLVKSVYPQRVFEESSWIDSVCRNLQRSRFLLLIVGDGIRESVEEMVAFLSRNPAQLFTLALIEVQLYRVNTDSDEELLLIPQVIARTRELERAVVRVEGDQIQRIQVSVDTLSELSAVGSGQRRATLTEEDFFQTLERNVTPDELGFTKQLILDMQREGCKIEWMSTAFGVKFPDPQDVGFKFSIFQINQEGILGGGFGYAPYDNLNIPRTVAESLANNLAQIFPALSPRPSKTGVWFAGIPLREVIARYSELKGYVQNFQITIRAQLEKT